MLNNFRHFPCVALAVVLSGMLYFSIPAMAQSEPSPATTATAAPAEGPLTVTDILVDKTDKNAVVARDQAIIEAQRTAFRSLCEKWMSPEALKTYNYPDDKTIAALVQDFEIKNEQISANRYMATFTVRFSPDINNYIKIPADGASTIASSTPAASALPTAPAATMAPREVLVLPYFENTSGKKILWEDPNPWREAWQAAGNSTAADGLTITVPLGDLADIAAGSSDAVWAEDYSVVERLRISYTVVEVALAVARKSDEKIQVDLYIYKDGRLERKKSVAPYTPALGDKDAFKPLIPQMIGAIRSAAPFTEGGEALSEPAREVTPLSVPPTAPPEKIVLDATMTFDNFAQWLEVQRRLFSVSPAPSVEISSLTKSSAKFSISYDGGLDALRNALAEKGIALEQPVVEVDESVLGSSKLTQKSVYELKLTN
jgi:hypothetical protein